ncbi:MAG: hypothetical protein ACRDRP_09885 [Pseudonocardiaceae bacterium]
MFQDAQCVLGGLEPRIGALAAQQEARGWAMIGDVDHCRRQLDTAAELLRVDSGEPDLAGPVYLQHYDSNTLDVALRARWPDEPDEPDTRAFHDALAASAAAGTPRWR